MSVSLSRIALGPLLLLAVAVDACSSPTAPADPDGLTPATSRSELQGTTLDGLLSANWDCQQRGPTFISCARLAFATGGVLIQMEEELIAFVPVLLLLTRRLGFPPLVATAMSLGASMVGAAFSPINPWITGDSRVDRHAGAVDLVERQVNKWDWRFVQLVVLGITRKPDDGERFVRQIGDDG